MSDDSSLEFPQSEVDSEADYNSEVVENTGTGTVTWQPEILQIMAEQGFTPDSEDFESMPVDASDSEKEGEFDRFTVLPVIT
jgi:hypothetical protein